MAIRMPTYFISHGGGPWPWVPEMRAGFSVLEAALARMPEEIGVRPEAMLFVSGHWETDGFAVMHSDRPAMVYDYHGFPAHTYQITYPAPGAPAIAARAHDLIAAAGLPVRLDDTRGFDHGTFAPAAVIYPDADVPVFQVSIDRGYDPAAHFALGRALAPLRDAGVVIVGSGLSYHNLRLMGPEARAPSAEFDSWLGAALDLPPAERTAAMTNWEDAPSARVCHPQEDHFVPLFTALGAAEDGLATRVYHESGFFGGVTASSYRFD